MEYYTPDTSNMSTSVDVALGSLDSKSAKATNTTSSKSESSSKSHSKSHSKSDSNSHSKSGSKSHSKPSSKSEEPDSSKKSKHGKTHTHKHKSGTKSNTEHAGSTSNSAVPFQAGIDNTHPRGAAHPINDDSQVVQRYFEDPNAPWSSFAIVDNTDSVEESEQAHRQAMATHLASLRYRRT